MVWASGRFPGYSFCTDACERIAIQSNFLNFCIKTTYTRQQVETRLSNQYATWFANQTQAQAVIKIWEDNYLPPGTSDDDHKAWLKFAVDVIEF